MPDAGTIRARLELIPSSGALGGGSGGDPVLKQTTIQANRAIAGGITRGLGTLVSWLVGIPLLGKVIALGLEGLVASTLGSAIVLGAIGAVIGTVAFKEAVENMVASNPFAGQLLESNMKLLDAVNNVFRKVSEPRSSVSQFEGANQSFLLPRNVRDLFAGETSLEQIRANERELESQQSLVSSTTASARLLDFIGRQLRDTSIAFSTLLGAVKGSAPGPIATFDSYFSARGFV